MNTTVVTKWQDNFSSERFDYSVLELTSVAFVEDVALKVRQHQKRMTGEIIALGLDLIRVQEILGRGRFGDWLELEFGWTVRTAFNYMQAARTFGANSETVSELSAKTIYLLAANSTPAEIKNSVVAKLEAGERVDHGTIKQQIARARREARERDRRETAAKKRTKECRQRREKEAESEAKREAERQRQAAECARELIEEFGLDAVRKIARAVDDWLVRAAISREIGE